MSNPFPRVSTPVWIYLGMVAFSLVGSFMAHRAGIDAVAIARPAAVITLATAIWAAFRPLVRESGRPAWTALALVLSIGALSECVGLQTGLPFGRYRYTDRWWPTVSMASMGHFPLLLPFAWLLVVGASYLAIAPFAARWRHPEASILATAALACLIDQAMEFAMTQKLHYWVWLDRGSLAGGSPILNLVGWFLVSLAAAWAMRKTLPAPAPPSLDPTCVLTAHVSLVVFLGFTT